MPEYTLIRSKRRSLVLQINASGLVQVRAPQRMSQRFIDDFVRSKEAWITQQKSLLPAPPLDWLAGRPWWHLGQDYLVVLDHSLKPGKLLLTDTTMNVAPDLGANNEAITKALAAWQLAQAKLMMPARVSGHVQRIGELWRPSAISIKHMKTRWGSCSIRRRINLNAALMHMPLVCLDYVICHELAHLQEMNHGPRFYATQGLLNPDWQSQQALLKKWAKRIQMPYEPGR
jgi:predicted metal-dependent hydrolase